jgi:uncharacterized delta-60 repeat protein
VSRTARRRISCKFSRPLAGSGLWGPRRTTVLARYNANGTLDATFGTGGKAIGANSGSKGTVTGVAIQSNGQVIVVGATIQRYNTDGTLDTTFGNGGVVTAAYNSVAIQSDGRIDVASGSCLARYLASQPQMGSFTANPNPAPAGGNVTLTAGNITDGNPGVTISSVTFYYFDANGTKQVLGTGTANGDGTWSLTFSTAGWAAGSYTIFAQATDSDGVTGDPFALTLQLA